MTPPVMTLDELIAYFEAVFETCAVVKTRLVKFESDGRIAVRDVGRLQAMVKQYLAALYETKKLVEQAGNRRSF